MTIEDFLLVTLGALVPLGLLVLLRFRGRSVSRIVRRNDQGREDRWTDTSGSSVGDSSGIGYVVGIVSAAHAAPFVGEGGDFGGSGASDGWDGAGGGDSGADGGGGGD